MSKSIVKYINKVFEENSFKNITITIIFLWGIFIILYLIVIVREFQQELSAQKLEHSQLKQNLQAKEVHIQQLEESLEKNKKFKKLLKDLSVSWVGR